MRINAYLARAGVASRRGADKLIKAGKVTINGRPAELNTNVGDSDEVRLDGKRITSQRLRYIVINKPPGIVTTLRDPEGRKTIIDLLSIPERVVPVGRLDYNTTGALLLTNDGELAQRLMHPSFEVDKVYEAEVEGFIKPDTLSRLEAGVKLDGGISAPARARRLSANKIELTIHEGRKHQVKKMLSAVGLETKRLHRSRYADFELGNLKYGQWRELTDEEITALKMVQ